MSPGTSINRVFSTPKQNRVDQTKDGSWIVQSSTSMPKTLTKDSSFQSMSAAQTTQTQPRSPTIVNRSITEVERLFGTESGSLIDPKNTTPLCTFSFFSFILPLPFSSYLMMTLLTTLFYSDEMLWNHLVFQYFLKEIFAVPVRKIQERTPEEHPIGRLWFSPQAISNQIIFVALENWLNRHFGWQGSPLLCFITENT